MMSLFLGYSLVGVWFEGDIGGLIANRINNYDISNQVEFDLTACVRYNFLYSQKMTA